MDREQTTYRDPDKLFDAVVDLALAAGAAPLPKHPNCWEYDVDEEWRIAWNGHREPKSVAFPGGMSGMGEPHIVKPFALYVEYNGWMAGELDPVNGGWFADGEAANPAVFIAAVNVARERLEGGQRG